MSAHAEDAYAKFLLYFDEIKKYDVPTEAFAFQQGVTQYLRYIIKDRTLATSLHIIEDVISADFESFSDDERSLFEDKIENDIKIYNVPINRGGK